MQRFSVLLLVFLGIIVAASGTAALLAEAQVLTVGVSSFGSLLIVVLGLWIIACAIECHRALAASDQ